MNASNYKSPEKIKAAPRSIGPVSPRTENPTSPRSNGAPIHTFSMSGPGNKTVQQVSNANPSQPQIIQSMSCGPGNRSVVQLQPQAGYQQQNASPFGPKITVLAGPNCYSCQQSISGPQFEIEGNHFHQNCFVCEECRRPFASINLFSIFRKVLFFLFLLLLVRAQFLCFSLYNCVQIQQNNIIILLLIIIY